MQNHFYNSFFLLKGKYVSKEMIARRAAKCGDGSHFLYSDESHKNPLWGYGDKDIASEDLDELRSMKH